MDPRAFMIVLLCACSIAPQGGAGDGAMSPGGACDQAFVALLAKKVACAGWTYTAERASAMRLAFDAACRAHLAAPGTGLTEAAVLACAEAIAGGPCSVALAADNDRLPDIPQPEDWLGFNLPPRACRAPAGARAAGEPCGDDAQCASRWCSRTTEDCGVCRPRIALGAPCQVGDRCDIGLACDQTQCRARAERGVGEPCASVLDCGPLLWCDTDVGTCRAPGGPGEPGGNKGNCQATGCRPEATVCRGGTCVALTPPGQPCDAAIPCARGHVCRGTCVPVIYQGVGDACGFERPCMDACHAQEGLPPRCTAYAPLGASCSAAAPCEPFTVCRGGVCRTPDPACLSGS